MDEWLATKALQHQEKHLSVTKVLLDTSGMIAGYYTLATAQVDFGDLPAESTKRLPRRTLPIAVLARLGVDRAHQGRGLGRLLLGQALRDCWEAGRTFAFIAVILDCASDAAKAFYRHWDFEEVPGHPYRLFLSAKRLEAMMQRAEASRKAAPKPIPVDSIAGSCRAALIAELPCSCTARPGSLALPEP